MLSILCAASLAQSKPVPDAKALLQKIDEARGRPSKPVTSLAKEGTFGVVFEGLNDGKPVVEGKFRELYLGENFVRQTSDMGDHGLTEKGSTEELVWDLDPMLGGKIYADHAAATARRFFALSRGASPSGLYREFATTGTQMIDGREHAVLKMTPKTGKADTWYVDLGTGLVSRIDIGLPMPESADLVWGTGDDIDAHISFGDWRKIDGVQYPHKHMAKMGTATVVFTTTKVEPNAKLDPAQFAPPESVMKAKGKPRSKAAGSESRPGYEIEEREVQNVASVRVKVRSADISATLAGIYPEIMGHLTAEGAKITGPPFSRYHGFSGDEVDLEAGMPIGKPVAEKGRVKMGQLPAGKTVVGWHVGPYDKLKTSHEALKAWIDGQKLVPRGGPWEVYWTDPGVVPDPAKWRTQLFMPVEP
jgi:AraC family transcriptional regulator